MARLNETAAWAGLVLGVCVLMNMLSRGITETYAVFLVPVGEAHGWSRAAVTGTYSVYMVVHGLCAPLSGVLFARIGARATYLLGLLSLGGGYTAASHLSELWQLYLCIGVLGGFGAAAVGMVPASALVRRWFSTSMGTAMGVAYAGLSAGLLVMAPLAQFWIEAHGWRTAYLLVGALPLGAMLLVAVLPWRRMAAGRGTARAGSEPDENAWKLTGALRTLPFWALFAAFFFTSMAIYTISPQTVAYLIEAGYTPLYSATVFGSIGMLSLGGMILAGWSAGRFGRLRTVTLSFTCTICGLILLWLVGEHPSLLLLGGYVLLFGVAAGSRGPVITELTARLFPGHAFAAIFGALSAGQGLGAGFGSYLGGLLHDLGGGYDWLFVVSIGAAALATLIFWSVPALRDGRWQR